LLGDAGGSFWFLLPFFNLGPVFFFMEFLERNGFKDNGSLNSVYNVSVSSSFCLFFS
jgi:hypothetical protein